MNPKKIALLKGKNCGWCEDAQGLLNELDVSYAMVDVEKNKLGKAIAKKKCEAQSCLIVDGKPMTKLKNFVSHCNRDAKHRNYNAIKKPDRNKIADELLD